MRSKNALKNLVFYLVYEISLFAVGIIFPRFIIMIYGSEVNGLTSTINKILTLINLIQAGAVGAAIYQMYEPVARNDFEKQSEIIYSSKKFYKKITTIYIFLAVGIGLFYSFYLHSDALNWWEILLSFCILAVNGASALLFNSICDIYLSPHQKKYKLSISQIVNLIVHYGLLSLVLFLKLHFTFIYIAILVGGLANVGLNLFFYFKESKGRLPSIPNNKTLKIPGKKYLMLQCIGNEAINAAPQIIITSIIGLASASVFSVYAMIFSSLITLLNAIQLSFSAIFGNLVKTADNNRIHQVHSCIELLTIICGTVFSVCVGFLIMPFISLYTKSIVDTNYIYPILGIFSTLSVVVFAFRTSFSYVATVYGLFKKTCLITITCTVVSLIVSIIFVLTLGMPYVLIGVILNGLGNGVAILIVLKKEISWFSIKKILLRTTFMFGLTALSLFLSNILQISIDNWGSWILLGGFLVVGTLVIIFVYCLIFEKKEMHFFVKKFKSLIKKDKHR